MTQFTMETVRRLQALNAAVIAHVLPGLALRTLTVDVDGVVVSTGLKVERAFRGYNPHHFGGMFRRPFIYRAAQ